MQKSYGNNTEVSILLPNYNKRKYIYERLESIKKQSYADWELIIVDGYSDDDSWYILKSFVDLGYFTSKETSWSSWMVSPNAKTSAISCIATDKELDQIDLCIAYIIDIEARAQRLKREYPDINIFDIKLEELNNLDHVSELFKKLNLEITEQTKEIIGNKINQRNELKKKYLVNIDIDYLDFRIENNIKKPKMKNISIPDNLYL